jgi:hypothetical protein
MSYRFLLPSGFEPIARAALFGSRPRGHLACLSLVPFSPRILTDGETISLFERGGREAAARSAARTAAQRRVITEKNRSCDLQKESGAFLERLANSERED